MPKLTALAKDLKQYLGYDNFDRAHTGLLTHGRMAGEIVYGARKVKPRDERESLHLGVSAA